MRLSSASANLPPKALRKRLNGAKGNWPEIAQLSGVSYHTIEKIAQGDTKTPSATTTEKLVAYFLARDAMVAQLMGKAA